MKRRMLLFVVCALFVVALWLPILCTWAGARELGFIREQRKETPRPSVGETGLWGYPKAFVAYFADTFAYRVTLGYVYSLAKIKGFHASPTDRVMIGKERWLIYTGSRKIEDYQGHCLPTPVELTLWEHMLAGREAWLLERGIPYLFVQVPNKITIYPEKLPASVMRRPDARTRLDVLSAHLAERGIGCYLDLRPALRAAAEQEIVYYETGTHWNHLGAYAGYRALMARLQTVYPDMNAIPRTDFNIEQKPGESICRMMCIRDRDWGVPLAPHLKLRQVLARKVPVTLPAGFSNTPRSANATECPGVPRTALVIHDSFFVDFMHVALPEHFGRIVWYRANLNLSHDELSQLVECVKPDVVIEERIERLMTVPPAEEPAYTAARQRRGGA